MTENSKKSLSGYIFESIAEGPFPGVSATTRKTINTAELAIDAISIVGRFPTIALILLAFSISKGIVFGTSDFYQMKDRKKT